jgi:hypothetical protein
MYRPSKAHSLFTAIAISCGLASAQSFPAETLYSTYIDHGFYASGLLLSTQNVKVGSPVTVSCPGTGTCTIQADQFIQLGNTFCEGVCPGDVTIGFYVDGVACTDEQIVGVVPSSFYQVEATSELQNNVSPGYHTVEIYVRSSSGTGAVYNYNTNFRVYKP